MKQRKLEAVMLFAVAITSYVVGYINSLITTNHPIISVFLTFIPAVIGWVAIIILQANRHKILRSEAEFLGRPITRKTEDGYTIAPEDIHEAIEKLGYLEYEKEDNHEIHEYN